MMDARYWTRALLALLLMPLLAACDWTDYIPEVETGNGEMAEEAREVGDFDAVSVESGLEAEVRAGDEASVTVRIDANLIDLVETVVEDGTLHIRPIRPGLALRARVEDRVEVVVPRLRALSASGGADLEAEDVLRGMASASASGGGDLVVEGIDAQRLDLESSGGGNLRASGRTEALTASASGGADIEAEELSADRARATASGGADIELGEMGSLDAEASGGASICYTGQPEELEGTTSGGGSIDEC